MKAHVSESQGFYKIWVKANMSYGQVVIANESVWNEGIRDEIYPNDSVTNMGLKIKHYVLVARLHSARKQRVNVTEKFSSENTETGTLTYSMLDYSVASFSQFSIQRILDT